MTLLIKQSTTAYVIPFVLVSSSDHISGLTGKAGSVTVKLSKNGASGVSPSGTITETDATNLPGHYYITGNATDSGTIGTLDLYAKDAASDPVSMPAVAQIVAFDPTDAAALGLSRLTSLTFTGANKVDASVRDWVGDTIPARSVAGVPKVDVADWLGTAVTAATAGVPDVNTKNIANVAAALDANNLLKVDVEDVRGALINALISGRLDVNVQAILAGVIATASFAAGAIDSTVLATTGKQAIADSILGRNQKGGSDGPNGQKVSDALAGGLMSFSISGSTLTILNGDGSASNTRTLTRSGTALNAITGGT